MKSLVLASGNPGKKAEIEGKMARELDEIRSEAYRKAQEIIGDADAEAIRTYADAYNRDPEFYGFYRSLQAYQRSLADGTATMVLSPDSDFFRYFRDQRGTDSQGQRPPAAALAPQRR